MLYCVQQRILYRKLIGDEYLLTNKFFNQFMAWISKIPSFSLCVVVGVLAASCRERSTSNPAPKRLITIKVTSPMGFRKGDSAAFDRTMGGTAAPDSIPE